MKTAHRMGQAFRAVMDSPHTAKLSPQELSKFLVEKALPYELELEKWEQRLIYREKEVERREAHAKDLAQKRVKAIVQDLDGEMGKFHRFWERLMEQYGK